MRDGLPTLRVGVRMVASLCLPHRLPGGSEKARGGMEGGWVNGQSAWDVCVWMVRGLAVRQYYLVYTASSRLSRVA